VKEIKKLPSLKHRIIATLCLKGGDDLVGVEPYTVITDLFEALPLLLDPGLIFKREERSGVKLRAVSSAHRPNPRSDNTKHTKHFSYLLSNIVDFDSFWYNPERVRTSNRAFLHDKITISLVG
jgi:hypothetical protein